ncbi:hypothetical protein [Aestuariimicrobium sp. T2.26MG-19.2B]|uniref:hypothetical protein n=1 Tax=Aestuariimicrobium sp. T2.26MG-19.2B TaxID=3040679 RepID=UPI0024773FC0|nr:hypothetical protein [Aestuariimicrobium sp. T2.26MG-19.2B]CAI9410410.1 hypothetical protein AESSP_02431 [Aestuariimicrobium sp. T2.26MG-19.2B]
MNRAGQRVSVSARLLSSMMRGSLLFAHAALLIALGVGWLTSGAAGLANAASGGAMVVLFFAAGQGVQVLAGELDPRAGLGLTLLSYLVRAALLAAALLAVQNSQQVADAFRPVPFCWGVGLVLAGWLSGMFWAHARLRIPVYDTDDVGPDEGSDRV